MSAHRSVLIIRPYPAARRTAGLVAARGFEPFVLPLSAIRPLYATFPDKSYDAVVATSANAFLRPLPHSAAWLARLPLYCVGYRTAQAARKNGFVSIAAIAKNADMLCTEISTKKNRHFIYLAGRQRRPVLENHLRQMGGTVDSVEVYETQLLASPVMQRAVLPQSIDFILLYSAGSARLLTCLESVITVKTRILCLSLRIAATLPRDLERQVQIAREPTEKALFSLLCVL